MKNVVLLLVVALAAALFWIAHLRRLLASARMRGDMYRDISLRLDHRLAEQTDPALASVEA